MTEYQRSNKKTINNISTKSDSIATNTGTTATNTGTTASNTGTIVTNTGTTATNTTDIKTNTGLINSSLTDGSQKTKILEGTGATAIHGTPSPTTGQMAMDTYDVDTLLALTDSSQKTKITDGINTVAVDSNGSLAVRDKISYICMRPVTPILSDCYEVDNSASYTDVVGAPYGTYHTATTFDVVNNYLKISEAGTNGRKKLKTTCPLTSPNYVERYTIVVSDSATSPGSQSQIYMGLSSDNVISQERPLEPTNFIFLSYVGNYVWRYYSYKNGSDGEYITITPTTVQHGDEYTIELYHYQGSVLIHVYNRTQDEHDYYEWIDKQINFDSFSGTYFLDTFAFHATISGGGSYLDDITIKEIYVGVIG